MPGIYDLSPEERAKRDVASDKRAPSNRATQKVKLEENLTRELQMSPGKRHDPDRMARRHGFLDVSDVTTWSVDDIVVGERRRHIDQAKVIELAENIRENGLLHPVVITLTPRDADEGGPEARLVAGAHRLEAVKQLGYSEVRVTVAELGKTEAEIAELDENLVRHELSPAERAQHFARRKELFDQQRTVGTGGATCTTSLSDGRKAGPQHQKSFAAATAEATGLDKSTINRSLRRAKLIAPDVIETIIKEKPELNTGTAMGSLAAMPVERQRGVVAGLRPLDRDDDAPQYAPQETVEELSDADCIDAIAVALVQWLPRNVLERLTANGFDWPAVAKAVASALDSGSPEHDAAADAAECASGSSGTSITAGT
jgi:hypothetical protein